MSAGWFITLVWMLPWASILTATVKTPIPKNCTDRLDVPSTTLCCKLPPLDLKSFNKKCNISAVDGVHIWPCAFDCIYNKAGAINGTTLVLDKVDDLMKTLLPNSELNEIFSAGFAKCAAREEEFVKTLKRRRHSEKAKCSPMPMLYGICAYKHVFTNCPAPNWTNNTRCNRIRECERLNPN